MMQDRGGQSEAARPGGRMVDGDASGPGVMGRGMMGPGMMAMMMVMMDADGDGALSLQEVQAIHSRMFNYVDANKDGKVTPEELQGFFGGRRGGPN